MDQKQKIESFFNDVQKALNDVVLKHGIQMLKVSGAVKDGAMILKISTPISALGVPVKASTKLTPNAVARYHAAKSHLGLPAIGTVVMIEEQPVKILGLSSDGKRIKAKAGSDDTVFDVPLAVVLETLKVSAASEVAKLDATDEIESTDLASDLLANFMNKKSS